MMTEKTCCFTGHKNLTQEQAIEALHLLIKRVNELTIEGYTHFISSFANDIDVLLAQIIGSFRYKNKDLILEAVIPIENKLNSLDKIKYALMFYNKVTVIQEQCGPECFQKRNKYMIDNSDVVVALWDEKTSKETYNAVNYARSQGKEIIRMSPLQE